MLLKSILKRLSLPVTLGLIVTQGASATNLQIANFPYPNPLIATLSTIFFRPSQTNFITLSMRVRGDRASILYMNGRDQVDVAFYSQPGISRLMVVVPGLGGDALSSNALVLAEQFQQKGYSVLTVPNTLSWKFALAASETGRVGFTPDDARDLTKLIDIAVAKVQQQTGAQFSGYDVSGYSLGALDAAYLAAQNKPGDRIRFTKVILINPPLDIAYNIQQLDALYDSGRAFSPAELELTRGQMIGYIQRTPPVASGDDYFRHAGDVIRFPDGEMRWLIGNTFREDLRDVIMISQRIRDTGFLTVPESQPTQREQEAKRVTFSRYMNELVFPELQKAHPGISLAQVLLSSSLYGLRNMLAQNSQVYLIDTQDDFLLRSEDIQWLETTMKNRFFLFDHGGHVGETWTPEFKALLQRL